MTLDLELARHLALAPVFSSLPPQQITDEDREEFLKDIDDASIGLYLAEIEGKVVGELLMVPVERSSMHVGLARPERAAFLGYAATLPEARGSGAGLGLTSAGLTWAREHGYPITVVDWRETNLLASRFWPARGFRRTFFRLYRSIP
jgi:ribosomal protein S18 acetylase RimI-like enzyme